MIFTQTKIVSVQELSLSLSTMRSETEYELTGVEEGIQLTLYTFRYTDGEKQRIKEKTVSCDQETVLALLNDCRILSWNGFHGKHPLGVTDGTAFRFNALVNDGLSVRADGSQNFPKHFQELRQGLWSLLQNTTGIS